MALTVPNRPFGIRQCDFAAWNSGTSTYGTAVAFDSAQEFTVNIEADEAILVGDDVEKERIPFNRRATVSATFGGMPMEAEATATGATIGTTGTTPNQVKTVEHKGASIPPYGKLRGRMVQSNAVGDLIIELPYVRFFTGPQGSASNGAFVTSQFSGTAIPHPTTDIICSKQQRETAAALA